MNMCGEIDEEITIPELVKEGSLCPHQDYVYFNYPTKEEEKEVRRFEERSKAMTEKIMRDTQFLTYVRAIRGSVDSSQMICFWIIRHIWHHC